MSNYITFIFFVKVAILKNLMKIIVTHNMPDLDAVTSVWLIKRYLAGWSDAQVKFVPAGNRLPETLPGPEVKDPIEKLGEDEVIQVDTGLGPLDHHQIEDSGVCAASLVWDYVRSRNPLFNGESEKSERVKDDEEAITRLVGVIIEDDHFKDVYYPEPNADRYSFLLRGVIDGLKLEKPDQDSFYVEYISVALDAVLHTFQNKVWAEREIKENSKSFETKWGKALGLETRNDEVIRIGQKMGFVLVVRQDPRKKYVRIKANPDSKIDLTPVYERLSKMDPAATWYLHVSRRMLLNGSTKNPNSRPTSLGLDQIIEVLKEIK